GDVAALPGKTRAGSAGQNRGAILSTCGDGCDHILVVTRNHQTNRNLTIIRSIGGVERATPSVEAHLSLHRSSKLFLQLRRLRKRVHGLAMGAERQGSEWLRRDLGARDDR